MMWWGDTLADQIMPWVFPIPFGNSSKEDPGLEACTKDSMGNKSRLTSRGSDITSDLGLSIEKC
jgi:hypothetical protein